MTVEAPGDSLSFVLNGSPVVVERPGDWSLLDVLRDRLGIVSPKDGCQPEGQCGCCTVLIDGKPKLSCATKAVKAEGKHVTTLEGLSADARRQLADCFVRAGGLQCGYCIPGIALRTCALLEANPTPSRAEIVKALRPHLCRCTGYKKIIDAVELLARVRRGEGSAEAETEAGQVGTRLAKYDGRAMVLGEKRYTNDVFVDGMLHGALRLSDHPRALVRRIDTSKAEAMKGVIRVVTWRDVPGERFNGLIEQDWPVLVAEGEETRYVGDVLAAVAAVDKHTARAAAAIIEVEYEVREPVTDPEAALSPDSPKVHEKGNLLERSALRRGDVERDLAESTHVVETEFQTQRIEHMFLEPEACVAIPVRFANGKLESPTKSDNGFAWNAIQQRQTFTPVTGLPQEERGFYVLSQSQGVFDDRRQISRILGCEETRIGVELLTNGGAFGGKEDLSVQGQTALLAWATGQPVKLALTRKESLRLHPKRHPIRLRYKVGCDAEGHLTALHVRILGDTGAYASVGGKVLERAAGHSAGPYRVPSIDIEASAVYTNNPPCGAMRGFGANQAAFGIESCMDMLAEKAGIDAWEMRNRNILEPGEVFCTGQRMTKPFGLRKTLEAVKDVFHGAKYAGIACGIKNVGIGNGLPEGGRASLTVERDGRVTIRNGFTEMGQGLFTLLIQTAVEETALPASVFEVRTDTRDALDCGQTTGSRGTVLGCHGVRDAARKLRAELDKGKSLNELTGEVFIGYWACYPTDKFGADVPEPRTHLTYGYATQVVILNDEGHVERIIAAHDAGRVMNPTLAEGQIEGAIHMGLGYALTEDFVVEGGHIQSDTVRSCGVLRVHQVPEVDVIFVEEGDPECPYGARGIGEIGLVPTAAAVANAAYAYDGIRRTKLPMRDTPAAKGLGKKQS